MNRESKIRLVIADDHHIVRTGLVAALTTTQQAQKFEVVGVASCGYDAALMCLEKKPDILLTDLHMSGKMSGFQLIRALRERNAQIKIVVFTADELCGTIQGADACLLKQEDNETVINCLLKLASTSLEPTKNSVDFRRSSEEEAYLKTLSRRQIEMLERAAVGLTADEIASELRLARGTVNLHLDQIYKKFNVHSLHQAVVFAYNNGILKRK